MFFQEIHLPSKFKLVSSLIVGINRKTQTPNNETPPNSIINQFLVSKETVVLRRWERSKQKFGFIKRVDKGEITTVKDLES